MASNPDPRRVARLASLLKDTLDGKRSIRNISEAKLLIEAIINQPLPVVCVERIISSPSGLEALRDCTRADISPAFVVSHTFKLLGFLSNPSIKTLADGQFLAQILEVIAKPPTLWKGLVNWFITGGIPDGELKHFAWLVMELLSLPSKIEITGLLEDAQHIMASGRLANSAFHETREIGYRISRILQLRSSMEVARISTVSSPGGRHDNDFVNFRDIAIYPTTDEFLSTAQPFYVTADEVVATDEISRAAVHLDNQFRLLRADMLGEIFKSFHIGSDKEAQRRGFTLSKLEPVSIAQDEKPRGKLCSLGVHCGEGLQNFESKDAPGRKKFLSDQPSFLKHQAFGVLHHEKKIFGYAFIDRNIDLLCASPPTVLLQFTDDKELCKSLSALKSLQKVCFTIVDASTFAYEPVLKVLQRISELPLQDMLINPTSQASAMPELDSSLANVVEKLRSARKTSEGFVKLASSFSMKSNQASDSIFLDESQLASLVNALTNKPTIIQGPPGTGKSFIGTLIAKVLYELTDMKVLVISYTNHALDQFLEDLLEADIPPSKMVRLGSRAKCTDATRPLLLGEQGRARRDPSSWSVINRLQREAAEVRDHLIQVFDQYCGFTLSWENIQEYLEFSQDERRFYDAFELPSDDEVFYDAFEIPTGNESTANGDKWEVEGGSGYLYQRWIRGQDAGVFQSQISQESKIIWQMSRAERHAQVETWKQTLREEQLATVQELVRQYNDLQERLEAAFSGSMVQVLEQKRIVGCTTTGAAKYTKLLRQAMPDVVLVEEAGEILECHVLASLVPSVKQLVLIGDHKQLRPKINNYALSVEKGDGFDLNRSLFERLIRQKAPYTTLMKQHRMDPEISEIPRRLTYPGLVDGPKTAGRPDILGLQDRVIFVNHGHQEGNETKLAERRDPSTRESKKNVFEAEMVLKCVRYLALQGYKSDQMVVLAPYLGQVLLIMNMLKEDHDPVLTDLDAAELLRAGLLTNVAAKLSKKKLRISTIDNYQGEESDIVIASLTRSNPKGNVGFMAAPERLNVLVSRARNCLIMIGNAQTFLKDKRGKDTWVPFLDILKERKHLYDGLPVKCERHPDRTCLLTQPADFDANCPDGGCTEFCNANLGCGVHKCRLRCHRILDHAEIECQEFIKKTCSRKHKTKVRCSRKDDACVECVKEDLRRKKEKEEQEKMIQRDLKIEEDRMIRQEAYTRELQMLQNERDHQLRIIKYQAEEDEQKKTIAQQRVAVEDLKDTATRIQQQKDRQSNKAEAPSLRLGKVGKPGNAPTPASPLASSNVVPGSAQDEWEQLKRDELAESKPLDELMKMIGLEAVKKEFLSIKCGVDTKLRQCGSLGNQRFNCSLLGNPGTGKTTVARIYSRLLTSMGVIAGSHFEETTGARLASDGVSGCKKLLEQILNKGGGVLFIDEAYQLTNSNNPGGAGVLDFLLPEVENLSGKISFIAAGYSKQMESFFAHNPGLPSRFPIQMRFDDYSDVELLAIFQQKLQTQFSGRMQCEDGQGGLYCRIVSRRIGRGRGREGFGNARTVENTLSIICRRQADRLRRERRARRKPNDLMLLKEDLIGPEPSGALSRCKAWTTLQGLIGLASVKEAVKALVDSITQNYRRELAERPPIEYSLNKVFLGSPGTGKTTVAKLYGEILVDLGLLSNGEVIVKNPSDFVGAYIGHSEKQTKGILAATAGKVLVIDEAYALYGGVQASSGAESFKSAVIDTLVAEVQSVPGEDRCVLLLGYKEQIESMFQNVNPGLARRFPIASGFVFEDFTVDELRDIFDLKLRDQGFNASSQAKLVAMEMLDRARNRPNFSNGGEIDILLDRAKANHQRRLTKGLTQSEDTLEPQDFDENFDRAERSDKATRKLFENTVGSEKVVELLESYQDTVRSLRELDMDPKENIPFNFLFRGPPGTGKTTTAKKMGQVFYDMGFLSTTEVIECSTTDLIGEYIGQTGPKVQQLLDRALGRVLFVDEAYRLNGGANGGRFAKEAMDELVDSTTKSKYYKKQVIILAGYEDDINQLMATNPGLTSRFPEVIDFRALSPPECITLLTKLLGVDKARLAEKAKEFDLIALEKPTEPFMRSMLQRFTELSSQKSWASARDVNTLAKGIFNEAIRQNSRGGSKSKLKITEAMISAELDAMFKERAARDNSALKKVGVADMMKLSQLPMQAPAPPVATGASLTSPAASSTTMTNGSFKDPQNTSSEDSGDEPSLKIDKSAQVSRAAQRDAGVSDEVWEQLEKDKREETAREAAYQRLLEEKTRAKAEEREKIVKRLLEEEKRRQHEAKLCKRLQQMGRCPAGFQWIKQSGGYRCAGGSHYMTDAEIARVFS